MKALSALSVEQRHAISKLEKLRVGALFMEPGTGKTRTAIELINSSAADFVLWIVPFQTKQNLLDELKKWQFELPFRIEGVESLSNSDRLYLELLDELNNHKQPFMVVDESLKIKNKDATRTKRVLELGKHAYYRLILNGTPISKNIMDIWAQMEFLSHKILNMSFNQFKDNFIEYVTFKTKKGKREQIKKYANIDYLYSLIQPYVFDAKLNLGINTHDIEVQYHIANNDEYLIAKQKFMNALSNNSDVEFLAFAQMMQQSYSTDNEKVKITKQLINELDDKTIIFCKFIKTKELLSSMFPNCLILTYGKGSLGLNLQKYKNIVFFDKTWDYAQLEQAKRRVYRIGQSEDVHYYHLTGDVGLENMMNKSIKNKVNLLDMFKMASKKELENGL